MCSVQEGNKTYLHEVTFGVEHTGVYGFIAVVECDNVKADGLRYSQDEWQHPDRHDLNDGKERNAHSLYSAPRGHSPVPEHRELNNITMFSVNCTWFTLEKSHAPNKYVPKSM